MGDRSSWNAEINSNLLDIEASYSLTGDNRKAFSRLLRIIRLRRSITNKWIRVRLFNDLAGVSARLRLYPIAMKCYYRASEDDLLFSDSVLSGQLLNVDSSRLIPGPSKQAQDSQPVDVGQILAAFDDGKTASAYGLLVHVKQPAPGRRKPFTHINNVGHMFITLIKYNTDNSVVCRSFGFYPDKSGLFSATPVHPASPSVIKDDAEHDWDEITGKFISVRRFQRILEVLRAYDGRSYHLSMNNCTDFGLTMAAIGGINIRDTRGRWPLGKGNNPANAGQSILEGKVSNNDPDNGMPLFVSSNGLGDKTVY
jgi:hypothetical protein